LKAHGNPIERRKWENEHRGENCEGIKKQIDFCKNFATQDNEATAHITAEEKAEVKGKAEDIEKWLFDMQEKQAELNLYNDAVLTCELIQGKSKELQSSTRSIINKPKPIPKKEEKKEDEKKDGEEKKGGDDDKSTAEDDSKSTEPTSEEKTEGNDDVASEEKGNDEKASDDTSGPMEM